MISRVPAHLAWPLLLRRLCRRYAAYALFALSFWQLASLADLAFDLDMPVMNLAGIILCSGFALVVVWPPEWEETRKEIRSVDPESLVEAYLEVPAGPARAFVEARLESLMTDTARGKRGSIGHPLARSGAGNKFLGRMLVLAIVASLGVQMVGMLSLGRPLWGDSARHALGGEPGRLNSSGENGLSEAKNRIPEPEREKLGERDRGGSLAFAGSDSLHDTFPEGQVARNPDDVEKGGRTQRMPARPLPVPGNESVYGVRRNGDEGRNEGPGLEKNAASAGKEPKPEAGTDSTKSPGASEARSGQGWDRTPDTKIPSPILEYRSWMERRYALHVGKLRAPTGSLAAATIDDKERELFESFRVPGGIQRNEDPYLSLLRNRWLDAKERIR